MSVTPAEVSLTRGFTAAGCLFETAHIPGAMWGAIRHTTCGRVRVWLSDGTHTAEQAKDWEKGVLAAEAAVLVARSLAKPAAGQEDAK